MNWYARSKLLIALAIFGPIFLAWFTESVIHLGFYGWCERTFGYTSGWLIWLAVWILFAWSIYEILKQTVKHR